MQKSTILAPILAVLLLPLFGCGANVQAPDPNPVPQGNFKGPGLFSAEGGDILSALREQNNPNNGISASIGVNGYLWRATLDTIEFMPLKVVDSAGGVLTTDWLTNTNNIERYRMNVIIKGRELRSDGVSVTVFTQRLKDGLWADAPTAAQTARKLEDTILTRARSLRVADSIE